VVVQPLVMWLWIGGAVMLVGTVLAAFPGRRRSPVSPASAPLPDAVDDAAPAPVPASRNGERRDDEQPVEVTM
jgi:cytochrome c-type biogenesis protein CcmF